MRFLIYEDTGEGRLSQKMRQIWTPQIFNRFQGSWAGCSSRPPSLGDAGGWGREEEGAAGTETGPPR